jgi:hypothetical protein
MGHAHLLDITQPLKPGMGYYVHYLRLRKAEKAVNGIIDDFNLQASIFYDRPINFSKQNIKPTAEDRGPVFRAGLPV